MCVYIYIYQTICDQLWSIRVFVGTCIWKRNVVKYNNYTYIHSRIVVIGAFRMFLSCFLCMHAYLVLAPLLRLSVHVASSAVDDLISPNGQPPALLCLPSSWASSIATAGGAGSFQSHASSRHVWLQMDPHSNSFLWALSENSNVIQVQKKAPIWRGQPLASWNWMKFVNFLPGTSRYQ